MPNYNYRRGTAFEYKRRKVWEADGYVVLRTAGSHGFADLIATRPDQVVTFIQCKLTKVESLQTRLIHEFNRHPPVPPSKYYRLCLEVQLIGGKLERVFR